MCFFPPPSIPCSNYSCCGWLSPITVTRFVEIATMLNNWLIMWRAAFEHIKWHSPKAWASTCENSCKARIRAVQTPIFVLSTGPSSARSLISVRPCSSFPYFCLSSDLWAFLLFESEVRQECHGKPHISCVSELVCECEDRRSLSQGGASGPGAAFKTFHKTAPYREGVTWENLALAPTGCSQFPLTQKYRTWVAFIHYRNSMFGHWNHVPT